MPHQPTPNRGIPSDGFVQPGQQLAEGAVEQGMHHIARDLRRRFQGKTALVQARVRHMQARLIDDLPTEKQQIDVERARRVSLRIGSRSAMGMLDGQTGVENLSRR